MTAPVITHLMTLALTVRNRAEKFGLRPDLTMTQSRTIGYIERIEEVEHRGVIQRELVEAFGTTAASVSSLIDGLEKNGYLERQPSPGDARRKELHLLPKARGLTVEFDRQMEQAEKDLLAPLNPAEQKTLLDLLSRLEQNLDPTTAPRRPQNF